MAGYVKWLDEDPEMMRKIPSEGERIAYVLALRVKDTPFRFMLVGSTLIPASLFWSGRHGPFLDWGIEWRIGTLIYVLIAWTWAFFLGRHEKGRVDIYPEMFVLYDYDLDRREARPCRFYYWADIVQYHAGEGYIWLESTDTDPVRIWGDIAKLRPYFEQYAPHAKVVRFSMDRYLEKRYQQREAERKAARKAAKKAEKEQNRNDE